MWKVGPRSGVANELCEVALGGSSIMSGCHDDREVDVGSSYRRFVDISWDRQELYLYIGARDQEYVESVKD